MNGRDRFLELAHPAGGIVFYELSVTGRLLFATKIDQLAVGPRAVAGVRTRLGWDISTLAAPLELTNTALAHLTGETHEREVKKD